MCNDGKCVVCGNVVDRDVVIDEFEEVFDQADFFGMDSLTENEQCVVDGLVCSEECFETLEAM